MSTDAEIIERHFSLHCEIWQHYSKRHSDPSEVMTTVALCTKQIEISPEAAKAYAPVMHGAGLPEHMGYRLLAAIKIEQGDLFGAIQLARHAAKEGWAGDWSLLVERSYLQMAILCQRRADFYEALWIAKMGRSEDWRGPWKGIITECMSQLAIAAEGRGDFARAIELSRTAKADRLAGDEWDKRIARCTKKAEATSPKSKTRLKKAKENRGEKATAAQLSPLFTSIELPSLSQSPALQ